MIPSLIVIYKLYRYRNQKRKNNIFFWVEEINLFIILAYYNVKTFKTLGAKNKNKIWECSYPNPSLGNGLEWNEIRSYFKTISERNRLIAKEKINIQ